MNKIRHIVPIVIFAFLISCKNEKNSEYEKELNTITLSVGKHNLLNYQWNINGLGATSNQNFDKVRILLNNEKECLFDAEGDIKIQNNEMYLSLNIITKLKNVEIVFKGINLTNKTINNTSVNKFLIKQNCDLIAEGNIENIYLNNGQTLQKSNKKNN